MFTKFYRLMGLGAIALTVFSACQREPKVVENNPNYNPDENTVKTKFYLNVSTSASTKTTAHYAQADGSFLGMEAVHLLTYNLDDHFKPSSPLNTSDKFIFSPFDEDATNKKLASTKDFDLGALMSSGDITTENQSRVVELTLPLNTNAVAIYGKAFKDRDARADDNQGKVTTTGDPADLMTLKFEMTPRSEKETEFDGAAFMFSRMFNGVITAGLVNEDGYFKYSSNNQAFSTGTTYTSPVDRSFHFWWPLGLDVTSEAFLADYKIVDGYTCTLAGTRIANGTTKVYNNIQYTYYTGEISWKQLGMAYDVSKNGTSTQADVNALLYDFRANKSLGLTFVPLLEVLGDAYSSLTTIVKKGSYEELRSGSAYSIVKTFDDLYSIVDRVSKSNATSWGEQVAKDLATEIKRRITKFYDPSDKAFLALSELKNNLQACTSETEWAAYSAKIDLITEDVLGSGSTLQGVGGFPENLGLPKGAAILSIDKKTTTAEILSVDVFSYLKDLPAYGMGTVKFNIFNYVYPAELMYYANSSIRTNNNSIASAGWPKLSNEWVSSTLWSEDKGWVWPGKVVSTTTSVGVRYPINYGSALCHSFVKYGSSTLNDNRAALFPGEENNVITVSGLGVNTGFDVTGIIIGGQPAAVGWDYTVWASGYDSATYKFEDGVFKGLTYSGDRFPKMVYDKVTSFRIGDTQSNPYNDIYTFVFDNYDPLSTRENQSDVYIALELVNKTGQDFWGELNLIRNNATFYIVGKVDLKSIITATTSSPAVTRYNAVKDELAACNSTTTGYHYPPFNPKTGETIVVPRVFMQDYETVLNLNLGENCLQHAYVTVPDLNASQVSLGLNVDITWKSGLQFDVDMGIL